MRIARVAFALAVLALPAAADGSVVRGGTIAFVGGHNLYLVDTNRTHRRVLVAGTAAAPVDDWGDLSWTHDGKRIAYTVGNFEQNSGTLRIWVANADGTDAHHLLGGPGNDGAFDPTWSPDGRRLAFSAGNDEGLWRLMVAGADGSNIRTLYAPPGENAWAPDWSPRGDWIVFDVENGPVTRLMEIHGDGSGLHQLARFVTGDHCVCADWSPDGSKLAYQSATPDGDTDQPEIYVMNADGTHRLQLTKNRARDENPDFSPDGTRVAFYSERRGNAEIYTIPAAGGQARRITRDPWYDASPAWKP